MVVAIQHIVKTTNKNILVCAGSNAACDEIAERLVKNKILSTQSIFRLYAGSYGVSKISPTIKPICNLSDGQLQYPSLIDLYKYRVIICTLSTAVYFKGTEWNDSEFKSDHFSYVFIDECTSAHETMTLIPICGKYSFSLFSNDLFNIF